MAINYQSLYRRFRPQRFEDVLGQGHVTRPLRSAVASGSVSHAYLFSGPRGTGKTSTARILAKALNCDTPVEGEPCLSCASCLSIAEGRSIDVEEVDAASNSGVDSIRWLIQTAATAGTGRWRVYIVDEVHMLSTAASNALLKTLEEPPPHVVFILATTNPQKVLATVLSRTQHYEFRLLDDAALEEVVSRVASADHIELSPESRAWLLRRGAGSARDTLSLLEQVVASGGVIDDDGAEVGELVDSLLDLDRQAVAAALDGMLSRGLDPILILTDMLSELRERFLGQLGVKQAAPGTAVHPLPRITRAMESLGRLGVHVKESLDPGIMLEATAVLFMAEQESATDLNQRIAQLEQRLKVLEESAHSGASTGSRGSDFSRLRGAIHEAEKSRSVQQVQPQPASESRLETAPIDKEAAGAASRPAKTAETAGPSPATAGVESLELLRTRIQAEWTERVLPAIKAGTYKAVIRDTRLAVAGEGTIAILVDHASRLERLAAYEREISALFAELYGDGFRVVLQLDPGSAGGDRKALQPAAYERAHSIEEEAEEAGVATSAADLNSDVIADNIARVFPGARRRDVPR